MCKCSGSCNCNSGSKNDEVSIKYLDAFKPIFEKNKAQIARVFEKHGFGEFPVNPLAAGVAYKKNPRIAAELAELIIPDGYNGVDGDDKKVNKQNLAAAALGFFGQAVGAIGSAFGAKAAATAVKNGSTPGGGATVNINTGTAAPPAKAEAKKIMGLSYWQAGLIGGLVLLVIGLVLFKVFQKAA